jgi:serine/threonine-protein kinase
VTLYVSSGPPSVTVPDVKGFTRADADRALANAKFTTKVVARFDATAPNDTVLSVSPDIGASAPRGSVVTLTVSQGPQPVRVPQLVGLGVDAARDALAKLGLKLNVDQQTASDLIPKDTIVSQASGANASAVPGTTIGVTVSTGPVLVAVPDLSGKSAPDAAATLQAAGLVPRIAYIVDATNATEMVVAQDPTGQETIPRHSTVTINVAVPGTVPDVSGNSLDDAKHAIATNGYTIGNVAETQDGDAGKVIRTEPEANSTLRPGEAVTIYYHPAAPQ